MSEKIRTFHTEWNFPYRLNNQAIIRIFVFISVLMISPALISCSDKTIDRDKFIDAYVDLRVAEDTVKSENYDFQKLEDEILKKHGITTEEYNATFKYFKDNPELWEEFYNKAIARVDTLKKRKK